MAEKKVLRYGVVGLGIMGNHHLRVLSNIRYIEAAGVYDTQEEVRSRVAERHRTTPFDTLDRLLEARPDFVVIAAPTAEHFSITINALDRGINVFVEKPIATTVDEGEEITRVAQEKELEVMVGHVERYNPVVLRLKELLDEGKLGEIYRITTMRVGPYPPTVGKGVNIDLAVHDLDLVEYLTGKQIRELTGRGRSVVGEEHLDTTDMFGVLEGGATLNLTADWISPVKRREIAIVGEKGMLVADYMLQTLTFYENPKKLGSLEYADVLRGVNSGESHGYSIRRAEPLMLQARHFVDNVLCKGEKPSPTAEEATRALGNALRVEKY